MYQLAFDVIESIKPYFTIEEYQDPPRLVGIFCYLNMLRFEKNFASIKDPKAIKESVGQAPSYAQIQRCPKGAFWAILVAM